MSAEADRQIQSLTESEFKPMSIMIEIERLCHRYGDGTVALENVDLRVEKGEFVLIAGSNGSGKTTLLRHLNGLLLPDRGTVKVAGLNVAKNLKRVRQIVGMVFQDADSQIVGETVYDDVAFGPENLRMPEDEVRERVRQALESVGLWESRQKRPHLLSGGEKRRLAIAGVLAMASEVVVFDEPFSNLDYPATKQVLSRMIELHDRGTTILATTHDLEKVAAHAQRLVVMQNGRVVRDGRPPETARGVEQFGIREPVSFRNGGEFVSWLN